MASTGEPVEVKGEGPASNQEDGAKGNPASQKDEEEGVVVASCCFVNYLVRFPCIGACIIMGVTLICAFVTARTIQREGTDVFATDGGSNEIGDIRTREWEAFGAATAQSRDWNTADEKGETPDNKTYPQQTQGGPVVLKVFVAKDSDNLFTSENLEQIRQVEDKIIGEEDWPKYCKRQDRSGEDKTCARPLSPLSIFYVDGVNVKNIFDELDAMDNTTDGELALFSTPHLSLQLSLLHTQVFALLGPVFSGGAPNGPIADCSLKIAEGQAAVVQCLSEVVVSTMDPPPNQTTLDIYKAMAPLVFALDRARSNQQQDVEATLKLSAYMKTVGFFAPRVDYYFDKDFSVANPKSKYSRGIISMGYPLEGYKNSADRDTEQAEKVEKWFSASFSQYLKNTREVGGVEVLFFATVLAEEELIQILLFDALRVFVSLALVFLWIWLQTTSLFIAVCGVLEIVLSVPIAFLMYYHIFGIKFFDTLNSMTIFIVVAIGADDIFVFMDQYKQSAYLRDVCVDLKTRMNWVYSRAAWAMFVTSATTCVAFVCTAVSPLPSIRSFGIFSAFVILADFILVITWFPACVVLYHNYLESRPCCCAFNQVKEMWPCQWKGGETSSARALARSAEEVPAKRYLEQLMSGKFAAFLSRFAPFIVVFFLVLAIPLTYLASGIQELSRAEDFLPSDHPFQRLITLSGEAFPSSAQLSNTPVYVVWGVDEMDNSNVRRLMDPKSEGTLKWDMNFVFDEATQQHIWSVCDEVRKMEEPGLEDFLSRDADSPENHGKIRCPMEDWKAFVESMNYSFPVPLEQVETLMPAFQMQTAENEFGQEETMKDKWASAWGWDPIRKRLSLVVLQVESTLMEGRAHPGADLEREYNNFAGWIEEINDPDGRFGAPASAGRAFQTSDGDFNGPNWVWMHTQSLYRQSAIQGALIGTILAFGVILLATQQIIIAFTTLVSIACILASVLAAMRLADYEMGTITSICITILAGFAVDYVVHLAHAYKHSKKATRAEKFQDTFDVIGVSVLSGMVTSVLAAFVLMFCSLQFFSKFGFFLFFTVAFAWIWGNLFFMCVMRICGPDDNTHWVLQLPHSKLPNIPDRFRWKRVVVTAEMNEKEPTA